MLLEDRNLGQVCLTPRYAWDSRVLAELARKSGKKKCVRDRESKYLGPISKNPLTIYYWEPGLAVPSRLALLGLCFQ